MATQPYALPIATVCDVFGNATLQIGPVNQSRWFGGVLIGSTVGAAIWKLTVGASPAGSTQGPTSNLGPIVLAPGQQATLTIAAAGPNAQITGTLSGTLADELDELPAPPAGSSSQVAIQAPGRWNAAGQVIAVAVAGTPLDLTAIIAGGVFAVILYNPGPNRIQVKSSGAASADVILETLYQDDSLRVTVPLVLTLLAPDGVQNLNMLTLNY